MDIQITVDEFQAKIENQDFCWLIVSQMHQFRFNGFFQIHGDFAADCMYRNMMFAAKLRERKLCSKTFAFLCHGVFSCPVNSHQKNNDQWDICTYAFGSKWVFQNYANCLFVPSTVLQMEPDADDPLAGNLLGADADGYLHCNSVLRIVLATRATKLERFHFILLGAY